MVLIRNASRPGDFSVMKPGKPDPVSAFVRKREYKVPERLDAKASAKLLLDDIVSMLARVGMSRRRFEALATYPDLVTHLAEGRAPKAETEKRLRGVMANIEKGTIA